MAVEQYPLLLERSIIFGVGIGNLGRARQRRVPTADRVTEINERLRVRALAAYIACAFGHTANYVMCCESHPPLELIGKVREALGFESAILPVANVRTALRDASSGTEPPRETGRRWTDGIAFHVSGTLTQTEAKSTERAVLWRISRDQVGIWKRDIETPEGQLDRDRRKGGWGAVAGEISKQLGGSWTARSLRTVAGIVRKAESLSS
ncbi:MAG: hypothetical protein FJZ38_20400 [Candidatus Rokubacteria bacterium]|nr:hypothetical protein [Candidatus Rokubacteria bacterium]